MRTPPYTPAPCRKFVATPLIQASKLAHVLHTTWICEMSLHVDVVRARVLQGIWQARATVSRLVISIHRASNGRFNVLIY